VNIRISAHILVQNLDDVSMPAVDHAVRMECDANDAFSLSLDDGVGTLLRNSYLEIVDAAKEKERNNVVPVR
jgi:hypothetical protein